MAAIPLVTKLQDHLQKELAELNVRGRKRDSKALVQVYRSCLRMMVRRVGGRSTCSLSPHHRHHHH